MNHIIITGTGRSGTTLLMRILTLAGYDTGFTEEQVMSAHRVLGGLECRKKNPAKWPKYVKSPYFCDTLRQYLRGGARIERVVVPIRELARVRRSREKRGIKWGGRIPSANELSRKMYELLHACAEYDVPIVFLPFPQWLDSWVYVANAFGITEVDSLLAAFDRCLSK